MKGHSYSLDQSGELWWCNSHQRRATHLFTQHEGIPFTDHCCDIASVHLCEFSGVGGNFRRLKTRLLTVSTPFWTARCRWVYRDSKWEPVIFDKELNFLKGLTQEQAREELQRLGATWSWSPVREEPCPEMT